MNTIELIENYLDGNLDKNQIQEMEEKRSSDSAFNELVNLHKDINKCIIEDDIIEFRDMLNKTYDNQYSNQGKSTQTSNRTFYLNSILALVASIIFIFGSVHLKTNFLTSYPAGTLFEKYYTTYKSDLVYRSLEEKEDLFSTAIKQYDSGQYQNSLTNFDEILKKDKENYLARYYKALSLMELESYKLAIIEFEKALESTSKVYDEHIKWYMSMCYLKMNKTKNATILLNNLVRNSDFYNQRAQKVLRRL